MSLSITYVPNHFGSLSPEMNLQPVRNLKSFRWIRCFTYRSLRTIALLAAEFLCKVKARLWAFPWGPVRWGLGPTGPGSGYSVMPDFLSLSVLRNSLITPEADD